MKQAADGPIVIVGGGIIGMSIAHHLAEAGHPEVVVVERGQVGEGATAAATGGIRQQFTSRINVELVRDSIKFYRHFEDRVGAPLDLRQHGYLFLVDKQEALDSLAAGVELQRSLGVPTELLTPERVVDIFPEVRTDDLVGATYCPTDGSASPTDAVAGLALSCRRLGVRVIENAEVSGLKRDASRHVRAVTASGGSIEACSVVIATGPIAAETGRRLGVDIPVKPYRRQAFAISPLPWLEPGRPFTVDLGTGAYLHPEVAGGVIGGTDRDVPSSMNTAVDWDRLEPLVAALASRLPRMVEATVSRGWAGLREMTPDDHALLGPVQGQPSLWIAAGFSGHGFMQAPTVGRELAAWLLRGAPELDLTPLDPNRFKQGVSGSEAVKF